MSRFHFIPPQNFQRSSVPSSRQTIHFTPPQGYDTQAAIPLPTSVIFSPSGNNRVFSPSLNQMVFG